MTEDRQFLSPEDRNAQRLADQDATAQGNGIVGTIRNAFHAFARPFVTGDSDLDHADQTALKSERALNDEDSRT